ncbi:hypothetical protein DDB_G0278415 [Dictyostelium discoideum AX4]|uniref:AB hydrolase-1 domain-containing protein n=1 Tax=Dictyostelium discoideum TaxID=44689 RepID=Q54Y48_DICDI|nr:hypothetical protein DDB_G0278415 [Dictyostelium discoideum AX4]EAL68380.1 hypothetical protein DDB_G0278415 [Dictyostelium discoideum AX4]|eukprot:XP_642354.1 hypothetical protein DDB_G0278415 [Dictyostelium discoideum AX4]
MIRNNNKFSNIYKNCKRYYCNSNTNNGKPVDLVFNIQNPTTTTNGVGKNLNEIKNIIILHGLFGAGGNWRSVSPKIADLTNCNVIQVDQRNHGTSPHSDEFSYKLMSDDLNQLINKQSIEDLCIIGHSMGGRVAMLYSLLNPTKVKKLIVVDISPSELKSNTILEFKDYLERMKSMDLSKISNRRQAEDWLEPAVPDKGVRLFLLTNLILGDNGKYFWRMNIDGLLKNIESVSSFPSESEIQSLKNSTSPVQYTNDTLFISGGKSKFIQDRDLPKIKQFFPNYKLEVVPHVGHWIHAEDPIKFVNIASNFINKN